VIIEDKKHIVELVHYHFGKKGFEVASFSLLAASATHSVCPPGADSFDRRGVAHAVRGSVLRY
jgi:hypothetical protein